MTLTLTLAADITAAGGENNLNPEQINVLWEHRNAYLDNIASENSSFFRQFCDTLRGQDELNGRPSISPSELQNQANCYLHNVADSLGQARDRNSPQGIFAKAKASLNALESKRLAEVTKLNTALGDAIPDLPASPLVRAEFRRILVDLNVEPNFATAISERPGSLQGLISFAENAININQAHSMNGKKMPDFRETLRKYYPNQQTALKTEAEVSPYFFAYYGEQKLNNYYLQ